MQALYDFRLVTCGVLGTDLIDIHTNGERGKRVVYRKIGISEMDISEFRYI
jgi:hypothetical protein